MNPDSITDELRGLKPPIEIPEAATGTYAAVIAAIALLLVLAVLGWWLARRAKREVASDPVAESLAELDTVRAVLTEADSEAYAIGVSNVLRRYVERHLGVSAVRQTTDEFLTNLVGGDGRLSSTHRTELREFLTQCDLVKFARGELAPEQRESLHACARTFIETTAQSQRDDAVPGSATASELKAPSAA